jgi:starch synthase
MKKRVVVSHPNMQDSPFLARALQKADLLRAYVTRLYYDHGLFPFNIFTPSQLAEKYLDKYLGDRRIEGIACENIMLIDRMRGILDPALKRSSLFRRIFYRKTTCYKGFSRKAGRFAGKNADAIVCYEYSAYHAFLEARAAKLKCILVMAGPHILTRNRIEEDEFKKLGMWKGKSGSRPLQPSVVEKYVKEAQMADLVIVASGISEQSVLEIGVSADKIKRIPLGVDLTKFFRAKTDASYKSGFTILFAGTINSTKGIFYLLEAIKRLNLPDVDVILVGPNVLDDRLFEKYAKFTRIIDRVSQDKLISYYSNADVFVFPSLMEGFGRVILEAMAMGLPVITTTSTAGSYIIEDGTDGLIVPPADTEALKEKILLLYKDRALREKLGINAVAKAKTYTWERYSSEIVAAISSVLSD